MVAMPWAPAATRISATAIAQGNQAGITQCWAAFCAEPACFGAAGRGVVLPEGLAER